MAMRDLNPPHLRRISSAINLVDVCARRPERYPYLLQSVAHGPAQARYDIALAFPGERVVWDASQPQTDFLAQFDAQWAQQRRGVFPDLPFSGGWFVFLAYELARQIEPRLRAAPFDDRLPRAMAVRIPAAIIRNHASGEVWLLAEQATLLDEMETDIRHASPSAADVRIAVQSVTEDADADFLRSVQRIREYIMAGDVFQVNLSRAWSCRLREKVAATTLYRALCRANPAPFAALVQLEGCAILSSSPERLVKVSGGVIETRPIAGTRPRGVNVASDELLSRELMAHPKERAEHIMLVDLERNDVGRVCVAGSVRVDELMTVESYAHVHHIVSNVRGILRDGVTPGEVIRAVFPGGTITGCPKVRCMEIIAELERTPRGAYTGAVGYLNHDGSMDLNILIRTLVYRGHEVSFRAGAGIVHDSIPEKELDETRAKARGLLRALGVDA